MQDVFIQTRLKRRTFALDFYSKQEKTSFGKSPRNRGQIGIGTKHVTQQKLANFT